MKLSKKVLSILLSIVMLVGLLAVTPITTSALSASASSISMHVGDIKGVQVKTYPTTGETVLSYTWTCNEPGNVEIMTNGSAYCTVRALNPTTTIGGAVLQCTITYSKRSTIASVPEYTLTYATSCRVTVEELFTEPPTTQPTTTKPATTQPSTQPTTAKPTNSGNFGGSSNTSATEPAESNTNKTNSSDTYIKFTSGSRFTTLCRKEKDSLSIYLRGGKGETYFWSADPSVVEVKKISNTKVKVYALKKGGARIYAVNNGVVAYKKINVYNPSLNKAKKTLKKGNTFKIKINGQAGKMTFKSSNKKIATVTAKGKVKAKKKGKATITVTTNGGFKLKCKITVK